MKKKKNVRLTALVLLAGLLAGAWYFGFDFGFSRRASGAAPRYVTQTIAADMKTMRTICWQSEPGDHAQFLEYREEGGALRTAEATSEPLTTGAEEMVLHTARLAGLKPGVRYAYRAGDGREWSPWYAFETEAAGNRDFKALIFGDSQSTEYAMWGKTAARAWERNPDAKFFVNMGDLVDIGSHYDQWKSWIDGASPMAQAIPVAPISGNHENYLPGGTFSPAILYAELFALPDNGPEGLGGQAYSFDYGDVHFAAIDSQEEELAAFEPGLIAREAAWLERDLRSSTKPWKIVLIHRNLFQNGSSVPNELGRRFLPVIDRANVDVVFTAHIHAYGRTQPLIHGHPAGPGARGTVYISTGRSGDKTWDGAKRRPHEIAYDDVLSQPNYLVLEASPGHLRIANYAQDGALGDAIELMK